MTTQEEPNNFEWHQSLFIKYVDLNELYKYYFMKKKNVK